jgi:Cdc6-like AAA superfamily ATPase
MPCFPRFDPADWNPWLLVNRETERDRLYASLSAWLRESFDDSRRGRTWVVVGEKGGGKSILTRAVLNDLKAELSGSTLVLTVDCRSARSWREVLGAVAAELVRDIGSLIEARQTLPDGVLDAARIASTLAAMDGVKLKETHERIIQFKTAAKLGGKFLRLLKAEVDVSLERSERDISTLQGEITIDEHRLARMIVALLHDLRVAGFPMFSTWTTWMSWITTTATRTRSGEFAQRWRACFDSARRRWRWS